MTVPDGTTGPARDDAALVADALEVSVDALRSVGREPLGAGSVTGFILADHPQVTAYVDTSGLAVAAETGFAREDGTRIWLHPADPHLPGLMPVAFPDGAAALLDRLGMPGLRSMEMAGYRPGRRAVLRVALQDDRVVWLKVVRPSRTERIVDTHRALAAAGLPVPAVLAWVPDGLIVLDAAAGHPAIESTWSAEALLASVDLLRDRLAGVESPHPARTSIAGRLDWYAARVRVVTGEDGRVDAIVRAIGRALDAAPSAGPVTIHGDLHLGQLFLSDDASRIVGLIDVDTAGCGDPAEDAAAFVSHATASAILTPGEEASARMRELAEAGLERWGADPRVAALAQVQLLGHALSAAERGDAGTAVRLLDAAEAASRHPTVPPPSKTRLIADFERS